MSMNISSFGSENIIPGIQTPDFLGTFGRDNPATIIVFFVVLIVFIFIISKASGIGSTSENSIQGDKGKSGVGFFEIAMFGLLLFLIVINGLQYFFGIDFKASIKKIFSPEPEIDITLITDKKQEEPVPEIEIEKQVFHIPDNEYTYEEAKAVCKAYGADLATYTELEDAYKDGAEWCSYGWSKDQLALYPTQKETYNKLQKTKGHEHDCGRPGINGGYIANPNVRFGINCFGYKPEITPREQMEMEIKPRIPLTPEEKRFNKMVEKYKKELKNIEVSPFNDNRWSII